MNRMMLAERQWGILLLPLVTDWCKELFNWFTHTPIRLCLQCYFSFQLHISCAGSSSGLLWTYTEFKQKHYKHHQDHLPWSINDLVGAQENGSRHIMHLYSWFFFFSLAFSLNCSFFLEWFVLKHWADALLFTSNQLLFKNKDLHCQHQWMTCASAMKTLWNSEELKDPRIGGLSRTEIKLTRHRYLAELKIDLAEVSLD